MPNANGTAPGLYLAARGEGRAPRRICFCCRDRRGSWSRCFEESVLPILREIAPRADDHGCRTFRLACVGESMVEAAVGPQLLEIAGLELGYCARPGEVEVRVIGPEPALAAAEEIIRRAFPLLVYSDNGEDLEAVVVRMLKERGAWLATAESCTGGYLANRLTNVPGASAVFLAGFVTYANEIKASALGVEEALIAEHGAVSEASGARHGRGCAPRGEGELCAGDDRNRRARWRLGGEAGRDGFYRARV